MNKKIIGYIVLLILTICWMGLIWYLSSENGAETAKTSGEIAEKVATVVTHEPKPDVQVVNKIDFSIRKIAHFALFFVLGILVYGTLTMFKIKWFWLAIITFGICCIYAFLDEWKKQFIQGRHFQLDEAALNMCGAFAGIVVVLIVKLILHRRSVKRNLQVNN